MSRQWKQPNQDRRGEGVSKGTGPIEAKDHGAERYNKADGFSRRDPPMDRLDTVLLPAADYKAK